jgi:ParB family chromosome partitioning protein
MAVHELKAHPKPFQAMRAGLKTFEFRKDDRGYRAGDLLVLNEWHPESGRYTGRYLDKYVTYILRGPDYGVPEGYVVMSLKDIREQD